MVASRKGKMKPAVQKHYWAIQVFTKEEGVLTAGYNTSAVQKPVAWDVFAKHEGYEIPGVLLDTTSLPLVEKGGKPRLLKATIVPADVRIYEDPLISLMVVVGDDVNKELSDEERDAYLAERTFMFANASNWGDAPTTSPIEDILAITAHGTRIKNRSN